MTLTVLTAEEKLLFEGRPYKPSSKIYLSLLNKGLCATFSQIYRETARWESDLNTTTEEHLWSDLCHQPLWIRSIEQLTITSWATTYSAYTTTPNFHYLKWVLNVSWDCSWLQGRTFGMTCGKLPSFKLPLNWQNKQFFDSTLNSLCENMLHCKCLAVSLLLNGTEMWTVTFIFERLNKVKKEEELWKRLNKFYIILCKTLEPTVISLYFASKHPHFLKHFKSGLER